MDFLRRDNGQKYINWTFKKEKRRRRLEMEFLRRDNGQKCINWTFKKEKKERKGGYLSIYQL